MKSENNCIFHSNVIEAELHRRFLAVSLKKLKVAQKGGPDPLRRSLHVLKLMSYVQKNNIRLEKECSDLLYIPITSSNSRRPNSSRMVVVIEQAPPQRINPPVPVQVPQQRDPVRDSEAHTDEEQDESSVARKQTAFVVDLQTSKEIPKEEDPPQDSGVPQKDDLDGSSITRKRKPLVVDLQISKEVLKEEDPSQDSGVPLEETQDGSSITRKRKPSVVSLQISKEVLKEEDPSQDPEVPPEDDQDGSSLARKRKAPGTDTRDSKLRIREGESVP